MKTNQIYLLFYRRMKEKTEWINQKITWTEFIYGAILYGIFRASLIGFLYLIFG